MAEVLHLLLPRHMEDQWIVLGAALGLKDFQHCVSIQTVCPKAIDRFRWNPQQPAVPDNARSNIQSLRVLGIQYFCIYSVSLS